MFMSMVVRGLDVFLTGLILSQSDTRKGSPKHLSAVKVDSQAFCGARLEKGTQTRGTCVLRLWSVLPL